MWKPMQIPLRTSLLVACFACCLTLPAQAQEPKAIVQQYCQADYKGTRLDGGSWRNIADLILWDNEPGWDSAVIVGSYRVNDIVSQDDSVATVRVEYEVLGVLEGASWRPVLRDNPQHSILSRWAETDFELVHTSTGWRIRSPVMLPHVCPERMVRHLQWLRGSGPTQSDQQSRWDRPINVLKTIQDNRFTNFRNIYEEVDEAFYSDKPGENLQRMRTRLDTGFEYGGDFLDPMRLLNRADEFLSNMTNTQMELYEQEMAFRSIPNKDTTIVSYLDYTGNGANETQHTTISKVGSEILVNFLIFTDEDTLLDMTIYSNVPPEWSPFDELYNYWNYAIEHSPPKRIHVHDMRRTLQFRLMAESIAEITGQEVSDILPDVRQYAEAFQGYVFYRTAGFPGESYYIWYESLKRFVLLYTP